jgi:CRP-like cAMP-binding protein
MAIDQMIVPLLRVPLFTGLKPLQITEIGRHAERIKFRGGRTIVEAGTPGDAAYLIVSGEAERRSGQGVLFQAEPVEPGSLVGEMAMLVEYVYRSTVVAIGSVHCLKITRAALHEQMRDDPALAEHLATRIGNRLAQVAAELRAIDQMLWPPSQALQHEPAAAAEDVPAPRLAVGPAQ